MLQIQKQHYIYLSIILGFTFAIIATHLLFTPTNKGIRGVIEVSEFHVQAHQDIKILEVRVKEGDYVNIGDTLIIFEHFKLHSPQNNENKSSNSHPTANTQKYDVNSLAEIWQQAKNNLDIVTAIYHKTQQEYIKGKTTQQKREQAYIDYRAYQAHEQSSRHAYEFAIKKKLEQGEPCGFKTCENAVIAEVEGEIGNINIHNGEIVRSNSSLLFIAMLDNPWGVFILNSKEAHQLKKKDSVMVFCDAFNKYIAMKIMYIREQKKHEKEHRQKENNKKHYVLKVYPTQDNEGLRPGMQLSIHKEEI